MRKKNDYEHMYKEADTYFGINDLIPDRRSIYISLPEPPKDLSQIDGWGLHPDEQYFRRKKTPDKLYWLEQEAVSDLKALQKSNRQESITGAKIIERFWEKVEEQKEFLEKEIKFIKNMWWWRMYGYWFYNDGKPTYISGRHFQFLNFFYMPSVKDNDGYPEYRDRHRREFLFREYLRYSTETFVDRDENGHAIPKKDGSYRMMDVGIRITYGDAHPKSRRNGSSIMAISDMIEDAERGFGKYSTIQSKDGEAAEEHYKQNLLPAWAKRPFWIRPTWVGTNTPTSIRYAAAKNSYGELGLNSVIDYTVSAGETKKDGSKINGFLCADEEGKVAASKSDVLSRWDITKNAMSLGDGTDILGYSSHISTVEDISAAGEAFLAILELSDFYQRGENGQTLAGLITMQFPAYDGLEGFIDRFGMSVIGKPTSRQIELRPDAPFARMGRGAKQLQQEKRDSYLKQGNPSAMQSYRQYVKKYPWTAAELHIGTSGDIGFDYEILDKRMAELRKQKSLGKEPYITGNFYRENNHPEGKVKFRYDPDGKFQVSMQLPPEEANLRREVMGYDVDKGMMVPMWEPVHRLRFTCGADPFEYRNTRDTKGVVMSAQSDGGIAVLWERDKMIDPQDDPTSWESRKFVLSYRYRPASLTEYNEDVLMVCEYYGAMLYLERNKSRTWEHFIQRGRGGYLKYDVDVRTGKPADKPGCYTSGDIKDKLFAELKDYILYRGHVEPFLDFLLECRNIQGKDEMTKMDRLTAHGMCLLGSLSSYGKMDEYLEQQTFDIGGIGFLKPRQY
ncbi:MAG: hypothetical protein WC961_07430 [Anaerovoracaceae bacterium]